MSKRNRAATLGQPSVWLHGLPAIADYCGVHKETIRVWIAQRDFPAALMDNGRWVSSPLLIDAWLLVRAPRMSEEAKAVVGVEREAPGFLELAEAAGIDQVPEAIIATKIRSPLLAGGVRP